MKKLQITEYKLIGNEDVEFFKPSTIWDAENKTIIFCVKEKVSNIAEIIQKTKASVVVVPKDVDVKIDDTNDKAIILVDDPKKIFIEIVNFCFPVLKKQGGIHSSSIIDAQATIDSTVYIGPNCVIGRCTIGEHTNIYANVVIHDDVIIGKNVVIYPGCVIGFDGFGYYKDKNGDLKNFPHYGSVIIEDNVEIGSNTCIDRGTLGNTLIKKDSKIDNLVHIAHNVIIGEHSIIIAHSMIGGSTKIGKYCWIAPNATLRDGIKIGDGALIGLGAVVTKNVSDNTIVLGNPAKPYTPKTQNK